MSHSRYIQRSLLAVAVVCVITPRSARAQNGSATPNGRDSVVVRASSRYDASRFHRSMLGEGYRDLWLKPIKVPVLDLGTFADGLKPTKTGGGAQTKNLRFVSPTGAEWVFRPVHKELLLDLEGFEGTVIKDIFADALSSSHPTGPVIAPPFLHAAGIPHPKPRLVVMPDDERLGEFRKEFAGKLGTIEEYPSVPDDAPGFAGAVKIIDSDDLLERINKDASARVDARRLLAARLVDFLLGDNDRHQDQWKWARLRPGDDSPWVPIPRDRDKVFVSHDGFLLRLARVAKPNLVSFERRYPDLKAFAGKVVDMDQRLLGGLSKAAWDSVAGSLAAAINDSVIDAGLHNAPREYQSAMADLAAKLKARRDQLPNVAATYYALLAAYPEIHATDAEDRAAVTRHEDGSVEIRLEDAGGHPYFVRRFDPRETREIRVYLHGSNDRAVVRGQPSGIRVRIIGGNGSNSLVDSTVVGGRTNLTRLYDVGHVEGVKYGSDSTFNRRPWLEAYGEQVPPQRDRGAKVQPTIGIKRGRGLGFTPEIGVKRTTYAFRTVPYKSKAKLDVAYSNVVKGFEVDLETDNRFEASRLHILTESQWSQLEVAEFRGFGNDIPNLRGPTYRVNQQQWLFNPAIGFAFGPESDVSIGPVVKHTTTDSTPNRFIAEERPYGFRRFGQAGIQLNFRYDETDTEPRERKSLTDGLARGSFNKEGFVAKVSGSVYPEVWDTRSAFGKLSAVAVTYLTVPVLTEPVLALRAGGEKIWGAFPYFEAAFLGGSNSLRAARRQRFAGDASLYASAELRVPVVSFPFILPLNVGVIGLVDAGRVYLDGKSPGGLHTGVAGGFWLGVFNPGTNVHVVLTNSRERRVRFGLGFDY